jgi:hypothetical protein
VPLITLTCHLNWYPTAHRFEGTNSQEATAQFGEALPDLFTKDGDVLHLEPGTTPDGVQVNYELFHPRAVNAPEGIWMKVEFAEVIEDVEARKSIRDELRRRIEEWFNTHLEELGLMFPPDFALDCFWGPDHGFLNFGNGYVKLEW